MRTVRDCRPPMRIRDDSSFTRVQRSSANCATWSLEPNAANFCTRCLSPPACEGPSRDSPEPDRYDPIQKKELGASFGKPPSQQSRAGLPRLSSRAWPPSLRLGVTAFPFAFFRLHGTQASRSLGRRNRGRISTSSFTGSQSPAVERASETAALRFVLVTKEMDGRTEVHLNDYRCRSG